MQQHAASFIAHIEASPGAALLRIVKDQSMPGALTMAEAFIVAAARTPSGNCNGKLLGWHPPNLAAQVLDALMLRTGAGGLANVTITERL